MRKYCYLLLLLSTVTTIQAQNYFPPINGNSWDTIGPATFGIQQNDIDSALAYLGRNDSKAFIVLKDGKILHEHYFGNFTRDSVWYWASAGKSLTAFAVGMAQDQGHLNIDSPSARYLGSGWTSLTSQQENQITVRNQLSMTSGLDDNVINDNCDSPACLQYLAAPGTRWAYHNAPYRLVHSAVGAASGQSWQQYFNQQISVRTGITGLWLDHVLYSKARSMARFGLLMLANGVWNGDTLLRDTAYLHAMIRPSQTLNPAYGYLWWLNGQNSFMLPDVQIQFPGSLIPQAPAELVMGLGKNDQKLYLLPSRNLVIIRMGNGGGSEVPILFDREFWPYLNAILPQGNPTSVASEARRPLELYPNPVEAGQKLSLKLPAGQYNCYWRSISGQVVQTDRIAGTAQLIAPSASGLFILECIDLKTGKRTFSKVVIN